MTTSSRKSYNYMALRGAGVDDMELVETLGMPEEYAYTPKVHEWMLEHTYKEAVDNGMDPKQAHQNKMEAARGLKELLAKNGMLK